MIEDTTGLTAGDPIAVKVRRCLISICIYIVDVRSKRKASEAGGGLQVNGWSLEDEGVTNTAEGADHCRIIRLVAVGPGNDLRQLGEGIGIVGCSTEFIVCPGVTP